MGAFPLIIVVYMMNLIRVYNVDFCVWIIYLLNGFGVNEEKGLAGADGFLAA